MVKEETKEFVKNFLKNDRCRIPLEGYLRFRQFRRQDPRIHPKKRTTLKRRGSWVWTEMFLDFIDDLQQWLRSITNAPC